MRGCSLLISSLSKRGCERPWTVEGHGHDEAADVKGFSEQHLTIGETPRREQRGSISVLEGKRAIRCCSERIGCPR